MPAERSRKNVGRGGIKMSPYKIEMYVNSYAEDKEPLYKVMIYDRNGKLIASSNDMPKEKAIKSIAHYCCVIL